MFQGFDSCAFTVAGIPILVTTSATAQAVVAATTSTPWKLGV